MEPIAIIGLGCRFPGAKTPDEYWRMLKSGFNAVREVPHERWDLSEYYSPEPATTGKMNTRFGGFLDEVAMFEPEFFGISGRESRNLDPQHRLLLEVAWETLEDAGLAPDSLAGSRTGVYVGISDSDYNRLLFRDIDHLEAYSGTGTGHCLAANRISYLLDLKGPSMAIDTACSSSLVALHLACQSLNGEETDLALVGAVNLILSPEGTIALSQARAMAADGKCKTFDSRADGYVRGEGCGIVALKRLSDARRDGDRIQAIVLGSAVNQDGLTNGLTAPSKLAQIDVIRRALKVAKVLPSEISYVEAHGTGTPLGDPIEINALKEVLLDGRRSDEFCWIGSSKTNLGHLEAAAGMAGLIKVVLALKHREIPQHLHLQDFNRYISLTHTPLGVPVNVQPWVPIKSRRLAGISAFSLGGTNCHVIVEEPTISLEREVDHSRRPKILTLRAKSASGLKTLAQTMHDYLVENPDINIADVCWTLNVGRANLSHRLALTGHTANDFLNALDQFKGGEHSSNWYYGTVRKKPKIAFLFSGWGIEDLTAFCEMLFTEIAFQRTFDICDNLIQRKLQKSMRRTLEEGLSSSDRKLMDCTFFSAMLASAELWRSWGVEPSMCFGSGLGELVAAAFGGGLSVENAVDIILNSPNKSSNSGYLESLWIGAETTRIQTLLNADLQIWVVGSLTNDSTLVSGSQNDIRLLAERLAEKEIPFRILGGVSGRSWIPQFDVADRRQNEVSCSLSGRRIPVISARTGLYMREFFASRLQPDYLNGPSQIVKGLNHLKQEGHEIWIEIGPRAYLKEIAIASLDTTEIRWIGPTEKGTKYHEWMVSAAAELYTVGIAIKWKALDQRCDRRRLALPTYPFQRGHYWAEQRVQGKRIDYLSDSKQSSLKNHPFLCESFSLAGKDELRFQSQVSVSSLPYLFEHRVFGRPLMPAACFLEIVGRLGRASHHRPTWEARDVQILQGLPLSDRYATSLQVSYSQIDRGQYRFQIFGKTDLPDVKTDWILHVEGTTVDIPSEDHLRPEFELSKLKECITVKVPVDNIYDRCEKIGLDYGANFRALTELWRSDNEALGAIQLPSALAEGCAVYSIHPVLLDAGFQVLGAISLGSQQEDLYLPVGCEALRLLRYVGGRAWAHVKLLKAEGMPNELHANLRIYSDAGDIVAEVLKLKLRRTSKELLQSLSQELSPTQWFYTVEWHGKPHKARFERSGNSDQSRKNGKLISDPNAKWLILSDNSGVGAELGKLLELEGHECRLIYENDLENTFDIGAGSSGKPTGLSTLELVQSNFQWKGIICLWGLDDCGESCTEENSTYAKVFDLVKALCRTTVFRSCRLWMITNGSQAAGIMGKVSHPFLSPIWGFGRIISLEHPELECTRIDLDPEDNTAIKAGQLLKEICFPDNEEEIAYRSNQRYASRLIPFSRYLEKPSTESYSLKPGTSRKLENLTLTEDRRRAPADDEVEIRVEASGLNFSDLFVALGLMPNFSVLGSECSGQIVTIGRSVQTLKVGQSVIAIAPGSMARYMTIKEELVVSKPSEWSFEVAAAMPIAFITAWHSLINVAKLSRGESVLIHSAAGGVGLAAVEIAQRAGALIYATASPEKWAFLKSLGVHNVMSSRDLEFAKEIKLSTYGKGVDIVLNSLTGEGFISASLSALKKNGRFLEIAKHGIWTREEMDRERSDVQYSVVDMIESVSKNPATIRNLLLKMTELVRAKELSALPYTRFHILDAVRGFRYMQQARHIGKIIFTHNCAEVRQSKTIRNDGTYMITGGLGELGLLTAHWLAENGARTLVLIGRTGLKSSKAKDLVEELRQKQVNIWVEKADVSDKEEMAQLFARIRSSLPPLRGIIHAAAILEDASLVKMEREMLYRVMRPKIRGAWNLHSLSIEDPLDFFVLYSSAASLIGSPGQANYMAANCFLDSLSHFRRSMGLPAKTINWGPWSGNGLAAGAAVFNSNLKGVRFISQADGRQFLKELLVDDPAQLVVLSLDFSWFSESYHMGKAPRIITDLIAALSQTEKDLETTENSSVKKKIVMLDTRARIPLLNDYLRSMLATVLGSTEARLEIEKPISSFGIDSLMAITIRNRLKCELGVDLPLSRLLDGISIPEIAELVASQLESEASEGLISRSDEAASNRVTSQIENSSSTEHEWEGENGQDHDLIEGRI